MNLRICVIVLCVATCFAAALCVVVQGRQITNLHAERERLINEAGQAADNPGQTVAATMQPAAAPTASPSLELLRLRSEVTRLTNRRRELLAVTNENTQLRAQLAASRTNAATVNALPPGYVRKSEARFAGYNTPADTIQSLLWAVQNHDFTNMMAAFTPEIARQLQAEVDRTGVEDFFRNAASLPGLRVISQQQTLEGAAELEVEIVPGQPLPEKMRFRQINGMWKLENH